MNGPVQNIKKAIKKLPYVRSLVDQRDQAIGERNHAFRERDRALGDRDQALGERDRALSALAAAEKNAVEVFHRLYYDASDLTWSNTFWLGIPAQKFPCDLWIYQEILFQVRPSLIIETGTADGGSALFLASILDLLNEGRIISIDIRNVGEHLKELPVHQRLRYIGGSSVSPETIEEVRGLIQTGDRVMVILDSDHSKSHVLQELRFYCELVSPGSYLIVEDTNVNGYPVFPEHGEGPCEAVQAFLAQDRRFIADTSREKFFVTFNPGGYLKRIA
jgi:cephalosporin hydroxylase